MLKLGTNNIGKIYLGNTEIKKAYFGVGLVYDVAPAPLPYDAQVEYLKNGGSQYISLPLSVSAGDSLQVELDFKTDSNTDNHPLFGHYQQFYATKYNDSVLASTIGTSASGGGISYVNGQRCNILLSTDGFRSSNGVFTTKQRSITSAFSSVRLFSATSRNYYSQYFLYSCKWTHKGNLVYDLIPVRVGTTGYLYDRVSGNLYGNSGTGSFSYGNDVTT